MTWQESLEIVVARTKHERYRWLCSDTNPSREAVRALMVRLAAEPAPPAPTTREDVALRAHLEKHGCCGGY